MAVVQQPMVQLKRLNVPLLGVLPKWQVSDKSLNWNVGLGGATATGEATTADVTTFSDELVKPATLPIGLNRLRSSFQVLETDYTAAQTAAAADRTSTELSDLIDYSSQGAQREILQTLGQKIITGTGSAGDGGVVGFNTEAGAVTTTTGNETTTNAYAGLDPATDAAWTNLVYTGFGALTKDKLRAFESDLLQGDTSGVMGSYSALAMSPGTASLYMAVFDAEYSMGVSSPNPANATMDLGYGAMTYNGRVVVEDPNLPDGEIHFVDLNEVRLYFFNQVERPGFSTERPIDGMLLYMKQIPSNNPQMLKFAMFTMAQLQVRARRSHAVIRGVAAA